MPPPLLSTRMIKSILHHTLCLGHSQRHCAQALGVSKSAVAKYLAAAAAAGLDWIAIEPLDEAALEQRLFPARAGTAAAINPDYAAIHRELSRKGMTLMLLWQEYQANHLGRRTLQYSQFCERYRQYAKTLKRSMRQVHRAGEKLFVDFAGPTLALADGARAHLFVAAMGASHYTYVHRQSVRVGTVIEFFGLCRRNIPDGPKQTLMVVPGNPFQRCQLHSSPGFPGSSAMDQFGLVQTVDGLSQGVVVAIASATDRRLDACLG